jgi:uncharacterized damage-inducible protein DinB
VSREEIKINMKKTEWFNRKFPAIDDNGVLPSIIERLAGTPARLEEITGHIDESVLVMIADGKWSTKEEAGHLADLEPLWLGRLEELLSGLKELRAADLTNQQTHNANHNATPVETIQKRFRKSRQLFVARLRHLDDEALSHISLHPRLKTPMRIVDLAYFVAEHDDHHLSRIREILGWDAATISNDQ